LTRQKMHANGAVALFRLLCVLTVGLLGARPVSGADWTDQDCSGNYVLNADASVGTGSSVELIGNLSINGSLAGSGYKNIAHGGSTSNEMFTVGDHTLVLNNVALKSGYRALSVNDGNIVFTDGEISGFGSVSGPREGSIIHKLWGSSGFVILTRVTVKNNAVGGGPDFKTYCLICGTNIVVRESMYGVSTNIQHSGYGLTTFSGTIVNSVGFPSTGIGCSTTNPCTVPPYTGACSTYSISRILCQSNCDIHDSDWTPTTITQSSLPPPDPPAVCQQWSACAEGEFVSSNGTISADRNCTTCPVGKYSAAINSYRCHPWTVCSPGMFISANGTQSTDRVCTKCVEGKFSTSNNTIECTVCETGQFAGLGFAACTKWSVCPPGKFISANATLFTDRICTDCVAGKLSVANNTVSCSVCKNGQFADSEGSVACQDWTQCPPGKFTSNNGQFSEAIDRECKLCYPGKWSILNNSDFHDCTPCAIGEEDCNGYPEWSCSLQLYSNNASYMQSTDCTMPGEMVLAGDLNISGAGNRYQNTTVTAAPGKRHFVVGSNTLILRWLRLTGGSVLNNCKYICLFRGPHLRRIPNIIYFSRQLQSRVGRGNMPSCKTLLPNIQFRFRFGLWFRFGM
jgi:hypothetical protein